MLVGLEVLGGVLLLVGEGGGCSWLSGTWSPTYWTSVLLNEEGLLGPRTWTSSSQGFEGWGDRSTTAVFLQFPQQQVYFVLCLALWVAAAVLVPAAAG